MFLKQECTSLQEILSQGDLNIHHYLLLSKKRTRGHQYGPREKEGNLQKENCDFTVIVLPGLYPPP